jgi:pSer/pThr/pTyr-binding forkhead associated (FHA) protein
MPKLVVSIDDVAIQEVRIAKERTTIGRRPHNDIVLNQPAVSGEHAVLLWSDAHGLIEDRNSTNGTHVNGKPVKQQILQHGDFIDIGKYQLRWLEDGASRSVATPGLASAATEGVPRDAASIQLLSGSSAGRLVALTKAVTTVGKPGVAVAAITHRSTGYWVHFADGLGSAFLNGEPLGTDPQPLQHGDVLELAGARIQFLHA